ncbi:UNVERIFIED_CONTAM: hypothetical protein FKN15_016700 [Acipenser sinensis]
MWNGDMTFGKKAGLGRMETLEPSPAKRVHEGCTESACNSPTRFADTTDSKNAVFIDMSFISTLWRGSNGALVRASSTTSRLHEGKLVVLGGRKRLAPFRN